MFLPTPREQVGKPASGNAASDHPLRSLGKALSWRVTGSIDTMLLSWFFTGDLTVAAAIGLTEVATKMVLYYLHERAWNRIPLGRGASAEWGGKRQPEADDTLAGSEANAA